MMVSMRTVCGFLRQISKEAGHGISKVSAFSRPIQSFGRPWHVTILTKENLESLPTEIDESGQIETAQH